MSKVFDSHRDIKAHTLGHGRQRTINRDDGGAVPYGDVSYVRKAAPGAAAPLPYNALNYPDHTPPGMPDDRITGPDQGEAFLKGLLQGRRQRDEDEVPARARGGAVKAKQSKATHGPAWRDGVRSGTQVQHNPSGKSDGRHVGRRKPITY
jgi:hypothetical protein